jgi:Acyclic terpene utilisation family protein AtuA
MRSAVQAMKPFRIGAGAGYAGDRIDPAQDLAERGRLDALVFECLAERTIALAQLRRRHDPATGFDPLLVARLKAVLPACVAQGTTVITNMGAANPEAAGHVALQVAQDLGLKRLRVAVVTGDDVWPWLQQNDRPLLDLPGTVQGLGDRVVSANAYLGADALLPALAAQADVVITGRVADPSLFVAPLVHHFGWSLTDWTRLGRGLAVGHLLECAAQVCGGYLADPGHVDIPDLHRVGFPLAEVDAEGGAVLTKLEDTGGRVDRLSCTAQLLYEVEDPAAYLQADVTGDFSGVRFEQEGQDRVRVLGAAGKPRPDLLKASVGYLDGYMGEGQISYAGPGARARGQLALAVLQQRLADQRLFSPGQVGDVRAELVGVNAMHGPFLGQNHDPYEVRVRLAARCATAAVAARIGQEVEALYLNGPAGGGGVTQSVREVVAVASTLVPRLAATPRVKMMEWSA